jgi:hypothetical protein
MEQNPFHYGNPVPHPSYFYGREDEIRQIINRLQNMAFESTSIVGERRIGKTSLLRYLCHPDMIQRYGFSEGYVFIYFSFEGLVNISQNQFWRWLLEEIHFQVDDEQVLSAVNRALKRELTEFYDVRTVFGILASKGKKLVLLFDEFEKVIANKNFDANFYESLRHLTTKSTALITSSKSKLIYSAYSQEVESSPFFNIFATINLRSLSHKDAVNLIHGYLKETPISFSEDDIEHVVSLSGCYPFFLQMACSFLFTAYTTEEYQNNREKRHGFVDDNCMREANPHFQYFWKHSQENERIVLSALALQSREQPPKPVEIGELQRLYIRAGPSVFSLEERGLIIKRDDGYTLFSQLFAKWITTELSDITTQSEWSLEDWWESYKSDLSEITPGVAGELVVRINPKYWEMIARWLSSSESWEDVVELFSTARPNAKTKRT